MASDFSAGLLMYRTEPELQLFLIHPGGPFFRNKDKGFWSIPKGLIEEDEDKLLAAIREFKEETNIEPDVDEDEFIELGKIKQKGGKTVYAWAFKTDREETPEIESNKFEMEWPPNSGNLQKFSEVDEADFFSMDKAKEKINNEQREFITRLLEQLKD